MILEAFVPRAATIQIEGHPGAGILGWLGGAMSSAGVAVNEETAMSYSVAYACTRLLAGTSSMIPWNVYRRLPEGGRELLREHPVQYLLNVQPNPQMDAMMFRASLVDHKINWGNGYAEVERDGFGVPVALWPIHPSRVTPVRREDGVYYVVNGTTQVTLPAADVLHVMSVVNDGLKGKGVITVARESLGFGLATERFGAAYFEGGAIPSAVLKHPKTLQPQARTNLREEWQSTYGDNKARGKVAVLWEGMDLQVLSVSPEDSQFLSTRQHNVEEVARWYDVPPHMIGHLLRSTFNNIAVQGVEYVQYKLMPHLRTLELAATIKLLTTEERREGGVYTKHLVDALQRGDEASRTAAFQTQFMHGVITDDEWREAEDRNPLPNGLGKKHFVPANLMELGKEPPAPQEGLVPGGQLKIAEAPKEEPEDEPEDEETEPAEDARLVAARERAVACVRDALANALRVESNAAERASHKPGKFLASVDEFYAAHEGKLLERLEPLVGLVNALGLEADAAALAKSHCEQSKADLLAASEVSADQLPASVAEATGKWVTRPGAFDPNQPRDENGRFGEGGGSSGGKSEQRAAEDRERSKRLDKEEDAILDRHREERQEMDRAHEREAREMRLRHNQEAEDIQKEIDDAGRKYQSEQSLLEERQAEEYNELEEKHSDESFDLDDVVSEYRAELDSEEAPPEIQAVRDAEDAAIEARRDEEDAAYDEATDEDGNSPAPDDLEDKREAEDEALMEKRSQEDDARRESQAKEFRKQKKEELKDIKKRHRQEMRELEKRHEQEQNELDNKPPETEEEEERREAAYEAATKAGRDKQSEFYRRRKQEQADLEKRQEAERRDGRERQLREMNDWYDRRDAETKEIKRRRQEEDESSKGAV